MNKQGEVKEQIRDRLKILKFRFIKLLFLDYEGLEETFSVKIFSYEN